MKVIQNPFVQNYQGPEIKKAVLQQKTELTFKQKADLVNNMLKDKITDSIKNYIEKENKDGGRSDGGIWKHKGTAESYLLKETKFNNKNNDQFKKPQR
jgi:hypothetical protein